MLKTVENKTKPQNKETEFTLDKRILNDEL